MIAYNKQKIVYSRKRVANNKQIIIYDKQVNNSL